MPRPRSPLPALFALALPTLAALALALPAPLPAATIAVDTLTDTDADDGFCSLREAIQAANTDLTHLGCPAGSGDDLVTLDLIGTIVLGSNLPIITGNLTIAGPVAGTLTLNGAQHRVLVLNGAPNGKTLRLERLTIRNGLHSFGGGCITIHDGDSLEVYDSRIATCESLSVGGAIYGNYAAAITLVRTALEGNVGRSGGGMYMLGEGAPVMRGGAPTAYLRIEDSTVSGNSAVNEGVGGGVGFGWANGEIRRSTLSGNSSEDRAGGLLVIYGTVLVDGVTLTQNSADTNLDDVGEVGGGLYLDADALFPSTVNLHNSVIGNNFGAALPSDISVNTSSAILSQGFNLIGVRDGADAFFPTGAPNANDDWVGSRAAPVIAGLDALADNGGSTRTHAPSPGSLLVDHGECPDDLRDQRGYGELATDRRPVDNPLIPDAADGCDIGALEAGAVELPFILFRDGFESGTSDGWSSQVP